MSEINVTAVFTPKPEKFEEVSTLVTEVIKQVQEHEPDTLLYYAYEIKDKNEIVIVERYKNQSAIRTHVKSPYFRTLLREIIHFVDEAGGDQGRWVPEWFEGRIAHLDGSVLVLRVIE
ncbi:hypothetical protein EN45_054900 [Penicillium chrysogenum]|uniref:Pc20g07520 protein n=3 Tax=Penicillium chrysogenum species complex TaxID=254878 RepID=B6HEI4_PENRW|nr:hypothetical protein EN45_054900 [Penicillium chrysogenum]CAP86081.1 Pc20g07520 [Penicillium rubens Wisconsin 54-1255]